MVNLLFIGVEPVSKLKISSLNPIVSIVNRAFLIFSLAEASISK